MNEALMLGFLCRKRVLNVQSENVCLKSGKKYIEFLKRKEFVC